MSMCAEILSPQEERIVSQKKFAAMRTSAP